MPTAIENVAIVVLDRKNGTRKNLSLEGKEFESIAQLKCRLVEATKIPENELSVISCGHVLHDDTAVKDLSLGPLTQLTVLRCKNNANASSKSKDVDEPRSVNSLQLGSFFVYCKECSCVARGKLRVYCDACESDFVVVRREPECWADVMRSKQIAINCESCKRTDACAAFKFKCTTCSEVSAALSHVRGNWGVSECCICSANENFVFDLGCNHVTCEECFKDYVTTSLAECRFEFRPSYGFTIACPFPGCNKCVKDAHHFRVAGKDVYQRYQVKAVEKLVALDDEGVVCPDPKCGAMFFWEVENDEGLTHCPECLHVFCRRCKLNVCACHEPDDETQTTIHATTKRGENKYEKK